MIPSQILQAPSRLGRDSQRLVLSNAREIGSVIIQMGAQARRELLVQDPLLEPALYEQAPFIQAVRRLVLSRLALCVRVLVFDPKTVNRRSPRLVELARRLSSRIAIQRVADEDQERLDAFLVVDTVGYIHRQWSERMQAVADYSDRLRARRLTAEFERLWERSAPDNELRRLFL